MAGERSTISSLGKASKCIILVGELPLGRKLNVPGEGGSLSEGEGGKTGTKLVFPKVRGRNDRASVPRFLKSTSRESTVTWRALKRRGKATRPQEKRGILQELPIVAEKRPLGGERCSQEETAGHNDGGHEQANLKKRVWRMLIHGRILYF